jgi:hypothetical protein
MRLLWRDHRQLFFLLTAALIFTACSEPQRFVKPGPLFTTAEKAPPLQAQVYFYWPAEEQSRWNELAIESCEGSFERVQPGGYTRLLVAPGQQCFKAEGIWSMESINATASTDLGSLDLNVTAGKTLFVRLEKGSGLLFSGMALRAVEPAKAEPEIKRCGQMIAMTEDEMRRAWQERESG